MNSCKQRKSRAHGYPCVTQPTRNLRLAYATTESHGEDGRRLKPLEKRVEYFDENLPSFALRVSPTGTKTFVLFYRRGRQQRRYTIGRYPQLSLADARSAARVAQSEVAKGGDPSRDKQRARHAKTFAELAELYLNEWAIPKKRSWRDDQRLLKNKAIPALGGIPADKVTQDDLRELLEPLAKRAPIEARHLFAVVRKLFNWARSRGLLASSPCDGLSMPAKARQRERVLSSDEIRRLWTELDDSPLLTEAHVKLRVLTAQRGGEILSMRWSDIDFEERWWTIPAAQTKNNRSHRIPLSVDALRLLERLHAVRGDSPWVFPGPDSAKPLSSAQKSLGTPTAACRIAGRPDARSASYCGVEDDRCGNLATRGGESAEPCRDRHHGCVRPALVRQRKAGCPRQMGAGTDPHRRRPGLRRGRSFPQATLGCHVRRPARRCFGAIVSSHECSLTTLRRSFSTRSHRRQPLSGHIRSCSAQQVDLRKEETHCRPPRG